MQLNNCLSYPFAVYPLNGREPALSQRLRGCKAKNKSGPKGAKANLKSSHTTSKPFYFYMTPHTMVYMKQHTYIHNATQKYLLAWHNT